MMMSYEESGRTKQKARTRAALIAATKELLAEGAHPTVEQAAERAEISASTAYRYFPNRRALLVATYPEVELESLLGPEAPADPIERLDVVLAQLGSFMVANEPELRAALRLSLEAPAAGHEPHLRRGRAIRWIEEALEPLAPHLDKGELRRLVLAVRATFGIEALVWLTDVGGLTAEEAVELMRGSASALVEAVI